jgi:hypothetical protein
MELVATTRWATSTNTKGRETSSSDRALLATPIDAAPLATIQANNKVAHHDKEDGKSRSLLGTQDWGTGVSSAHLPDRTACPVHLAVVVFLEAWSLLQAADCCQKHSQCICAKSCSGC